MGAPKKKIESTKTNKMGEMARNLAHEINTPLSAINLHAENIIEVAHEADSADEVASSAQSIIESLEKITKIMKAIRSYSHLNFKIPFLETPVTQILNEAIAEVKPRLDEEGIQLNTEPFDAKLSLKCRSVEIIQVLTNLFRNSIDAVTGEDEKWIRVAAAEVGDQIEITISDSGPGIPDNIREKIFEPLFSTKSLNHGMGVGLALCTRIVEVHGGQLFLDPNPKHTTFKIILPIEQDGLFISHPAHSET